MDSGVVIRRMGGWLATPVAAGDEGWRRRVPPRVARRLVRRHLMDLPAPTASPGGTGPPLELFFRIGPRDLDVAPLALASLRQHLANPLSRVVVSTPRALVTVVRDGLPDTEVHADEDLVDAALEAAIAAAAPPDRLGWVRQQFLSLLYVSTRARAPCLVWDADTIMLRPQLLLRDRAARLAISQEHHQPYFTLVRSLLPDLPLPLYTSTVAHHLVVDPDLLRDLLEEIERGPGGRPWWRALTSRFDRTNQSPMADYELYGQWIRTRHPDRVDLVAFRNTAMARTAFSVETARWLERQRRLDSVSLHWWVPGAPA
jgi:hypothetical protein